MRLRLVFVAVVAALLTGRVSAVGGEPSPEPPTKPPKAEAKAEPAALDSTAKLPEKGRYKKISAKELKELLRQGSATLIDVNDPRRYKASHIEGAVNLDYDGIAKAVAENKLPKEKGAILVFYCLNNHCPASRYAAQEAIRLNYRNVYVYIEGIEGWERWEGLRPDEKDAPKPAEK